MKGGQGRSEGTVMLGKWRVIVEVAHVARALIDIIRVRYAGGR